MRAAWDVSGVGRGVGIGVQSPGEHAGRMDADEVRGESLAQRRGDQRSAVPRISIPRGFHGVTLARSSTTKETRTSARMLRYFWLAVRSRPPMSMVSRSWL
jgi:hypothetical protein